MTALPLNVAREYYTALGEKNLGGMAEHLDPQVRFIGPLDSLEGKEAILRAAENFMPFLHGLSIRRGFHAGDQAMLALDLDCPDPIGKFRSAALLTVREGS